MFESTCLGLISGRCRITERSKSRKFWFELEVWPKSKERSDQSEQEARKETAKWTFCHFPKPFGFHFLFREWKLEYSTLYTFWVTCKFLYKMCLFLKTRSQICVTFLELPWVWLELCWEFGQVLWRICWLWVCCFHQRKQHYATATLSVSLRVHSCCLK